MRTIEQMQERLSEIYDSPFTIKGYGGDTIGRATTESKEERFCQITSDVQYRYLYSYESWENSLEQTEKYYVQYGGYFVNGRRRYVYIDIANKQIYNPELDFVNLSPINFEDNKYYGQSLNGLPHGFGMIVSGDLITAGRFVNGKLHGFGIMFQKLPDNKALIKQVGVFVNGEYDPEIERCHYVYSFDYKDYCSQIFSLID